MDEIDKLVQDKIRVKSELEYGGDLKITVTDETHEKLRKEVIEEVEEVRQEMGKCFEMIQDILKKYCDMSEEYYPLISLWIIGTYTHKVFNTYPYLYFNAMRGSGKTRILRLISTLAKDGEVLASLTEAVLFRTTGTLCIDEFENPMSKEKSSLRELLNTAYKKGTKVKRMRKVHTKEGEEQKVEEFETYRPICIANIWGMEEVLEDRCISIILEKSQNPRITKLLELFETDEEIIEVKEKLVKISVVWCNIMGMKNLIQKWNIYVNSKYTTTLTTTTTTNYTKLHTTDLIEDIKEIEVYNKIDEIKIDSRNLELFFPLLSLANTLDWVLFDNMLNIAKDLSEKRKSEEFVESKDVSLIDFVSQEEVQEFMLVSELTKKYKIFLGEQDEKDNKWLNSKWVGRALKRLNLVMEKRRVSKGMEIILDIVKAKKKIVMFK